MRKMLTVILALFLMVTLIGPALAADPAPVDAPDSASAGTAAAPLVASGVVTDDLGRPVAGAEVEVYRLGSGLAAVLSTGAAGSFRFVGADTGALWQFRALAPGYRTLESGWIDLSQHPYQALKLQPLLGSLQVAVRSSDGDVLNGQVKIVGPAGQLIRDAQMWDGIFKQGGLLSGSYQVIVTVPGYLPAAKSVTVAPDRTANLIFSLDTTGVVLSGEVKDQITNLPISGAAVEALRADGTVAGTGVTADEGRFRLQLTGAAPGDYSIRAAAAGYHMNTTAAATVAAQQEQDWSGDDAIALSPLTGYVEGFLMNEAGDGRAISLVRLLLKDYGEVAETTTDGHGNFRFNGVTVSPDAQYRVSFRDMNLYADSPWTVYQTGRNEVLLQTQQETSPNLGLGKVIGVVSAASGAPVAGAKVELARPGTGYRSVITGADGSFIFDDVIATADSNGSTAPYTVRITADGYAPAREFTLDGTTMTTLTVRPSTRISVRALLHPAVNQLRGRVTEADGHPVMGAAVVVSVDGVNERWATVTDASGWYDLESVAVHPAAHYVLQVSAAGYLTPGPSDVTANVSGSGSLPTTRLTKESVTFTGQAADPDGTPLAGVDVRLYGPDGKVAANATTDGAGLYRMTAVVARAGLLTLTGALADRATAVARIATPPDPGTTRSTDLVLLPDTATLTGRVLDENNRPVPGTRVELVEEGRGAVNTVDSDAQGRYQFSSVSLDGPGWFWLRVRTGKGIFAGSLDNQTELVPLERLMPGETTVTDLLMRSVPAN